MREFILLCAILASLRKCTRSSLQKSGLLSLSITNKTTIMPAKCKSKKGGKRKAAPKARDMAKKARSKAKGGGTKKVCLPAAKVRSMSKAERDKVVRAKRSAAKSGKRVRSSKSNVKGARKKGATWRDWFQKENWVQVNNPSKKCGE